MDVTGDDGWPSRARVCVVNGVDNNEKKRREEVCLAVREERERVFSSAHAGQQQKKGTR